MRQLEDVNDVNKTFTYQTRIKEEASLLNVFLSDYAGLYSIVERKLFADFSRGKNMFKLKNEYLTKYGITARQFNAIRIVLQGKIESIKKLQPDYIKDLTLRIKKVALDIKKLSSKQKLTPRQSNKLHQKKRLLPSLQLKMLRLQNDKARNKVRLCFGGKCLFKQQFNLEANKLDNHEEWQKKWCALRSNQFFVIGSKDETTGNQSCIATLDTQTNTITLKLRVPHCLQDKYGKYVTISKLQFQHGHDEILDAINSNITRNIYARKSQLAINQDLYKQFGRAINYRFMHDAKGWRVFVTCEKQKLEPISDKRLGAIGVDINIGHLSVTEIDRHGNLLQSFDINTCTYGKTTNQAKAIIGDAVKTIVTFAVDKCKPLVIEQLDFSKKKQDLAFNNNAKKCRQLSSFTYAMIINTLKSKAFKHAIEVFQVNPAYTSVIGRVKFARIYRISVHQSAAMVIARRLFDFSESLPNRWDNIPDDTGGHLTLAELVKIPRKHVWSTWAVVRKNLQAALAAQYQRFHQFGINQIDLTCDLAF